MKNGVEFCAQLGKCHHLHLPWTEWRGARFAIMGLELSCETQTVTGTGGTVVKPNGFVFCIAAVIVLKLVV